MNLTLAITYLFPKASPFTDFRVQDNGPTPVLREGVDGRTRYPIRPLEDGETEEIEGIHYRYVVNFNNLTEGVDYDIVEKGPYIAVWNIDEPQPTEAELQAAWEAYQEAEANKPPVLTPDQRISQLEEGNINLMLSVTQIYEEKEIEKSAAQEESINTMLAITELYEQITGGN
ncbi:XkdW protein [compost metagenome]